MADIFSKFLRITLPDSITCGKSGKNPAFDISFTADGLVPFPQLILHVHGQQHIIKGESIKSSSAQGGAYTYEAKIPSGLLGPGHYTVQVEGCKKADITQASGNDWVKEFRQFPVSAGERRSGPAQTEVTSHSGGSPVKVYFGIHKHMHQPYYNTTDPNDWDGEKDGIFGSRVGPYTYFIPTAVRQYIEGGLAHAGLSTSWSGSLIEQLNRCAKEGFCSGRFSHWNTASGYPRVDFTAFGFFHPLMALIPARDIIKQIEWHRNIVQDTFGVAASTVMFPPETAFHVRMIPALKQAGVEAVIYDSIHRFRACKDYPYAGINEGMLPPNPAEQANPPATDWMQLHNIWAGSKIAPSLLKPEYVHYEDPEGEVYKIIAVPAERYIGNEDARGGFGALQYPDVLGQVYDQIVATGSFDPQHPPFFLLHSDGDNHGGGADSYYGHNTGQLVKWLQGDPRFELITVKDYLEQFPPDPDQSVHIEPGAWSGADNGDPQFMKWFSRYNESYSPDLNSWAVLTAFQNTLHSLEDARPDNSALDPVIRLMLTAETSCYWYWTGQHVWDQQVTHAANRGYDRIRGKIDAILSAGEDRTGPTIFSPWIIPENPGGKKWGQGRLEDAPREGVVHSFIYDISGLKRVTLFLRTGQGEKTLTMENHGTYPSQTNPAVTADFFTAKLPVGAGDVRYFIEAEDNQGNIARSTLERVYLA
jgi:hypothetical protein